MHIYTSDRQDNCRTDEYIHQTDKITAVQMNVSNRQDNSCKDDYKNQTDKITAEQINIFI